MQKIKKLVKDVPKYIVKKIYRNTREQCMRLSFNFYNRKFSDYKTMINWMFLWGYTNEWHYYWSEISKRKYNKKSFIKKIINKK